MRWIALQSSITGIGSTREYILFDSSGTSVDALGRTVLYSYFESKLLTPSDDPDRQTSLSRTSRRSLFREDPDGIVYYLRAVLHPLGDRQLPSWLYGKEMMQSFAHSFAVMRNIGKVADLRAILESVAMKSKPGEVALCDSKHCQVCRRKFSFIRLRYYCRSCGGSVCRRCTVSLRLFNEANQFSAALTVLRDRFCINCVIQAREGRARKTMSRPTRRIEYIDEEDQKSVGFPKGRNKEIGTDNDAAQVDTLSISGLDLFVKPEVHQGSLMNNMDERSTRSSLADSLSIFRKPDGVSLTARNGMKAMHELSKSIAQQEALLLSLLAEQRRRAKAFVRSTPPTANHFSDSDRFEIIS
uniref:AlNc14C57G4309 protein n=1 Tax=Albugo laibachii Nc14 TaxID=890382 RepID=F0WCC9_9STRA|nr:AlNc14C57G4309 [Albugo laibachii Nc14]|eukprot:CCA18844.1 AlNc14C57G4309 [Albugo laibachii Nc14]